MLGNVEGLALGQEAPAIVVTLQQRTAAAAAGARRHVSVVLLVWFNFVHLGLRSESHCLVLGCFLLLVWAWITFLSCPAFLSLWMMLFMQEFFGRELLINVEGLLLNRPSPPSRVFRVLLHLHTLGYWRIPSYAAFPFWRAPTFDFLSRTCLSSSAVLIF